MARLRNIPISARLFFTFAFLLGVLSVLFGSVVGGGSAPRWTYLFFSVLIGLSSAAMLACAIGWFVTSSSPKKS